jgi:hypothetical protein
MILGVSSGAKITARAGGHTNPAGPARGADGESEDVIVAGCYKLPTAFPMTIFGKEISSKRLRR